MKVLVAGGAGYIGSHTVKALCQAGHQPVVLDTLEKGHPEAVVDCELVKGNVRDQELVVDLCRKRSIEAAMHFAAYIEVGESMVDPLRYYINNSMSTLAFIRNLVEGGVKTLIFSSTAAVYGQPEKTPITEDTQKIPVNVYGHSKLLVEEALTWLSRQSDFRYAALRYFNACGAHPSGLIGEDHRPESHLIPLILQVPLGKRERVSIYGEDYDTPDGTCVRDYIHVTDLARAHIRAMEYLSSGGESGSFNLGTGQGYSVREIIDCARRITSHPIPADSVARREGDPPRLVADPSRAKAVLNWQAEASSLESIVASAWKWHSGHPRGY